MNRRNPESIWSSNVASSSSYTQDAPSTSSSTLVNGDQKSSEKAAFQSRNRRPISDHSSSVASTVRSSKTAKAMKRRSTSIYDSNQNQFNSYGWSKEDPTDQNMIKYPDDHRCSDYELDGGLCGCVKAQSVETTSDSNQDDIENAYNRRLFMKRNRKILLDNSNSYLATNSSSPVRQKVQHHHRTGSYSSPKNIIQSDPVLLQESSEDDQSLSNYKRRPINSSQNSRKTASDPIDGTMDEEEIGSFNKSMSFPNRKKTHSKSNDLSASYNSPKRQSLLEQNAQIAARKSISTVYERLLREEEERRETERSRKEQARQRRKEERLRKQEDSEMLARLIGSSNKGEGIIKGDTTNGNERSIEMPPYTSPILAVSPPSTRETSLEIKSSEQEFEQIIHNYGDEQGNGHLHPAHAFERSSNAARLAALRAANAMGETNSTTTTSMDIPTSLGLAPAFDQNEKHIPSIEEEGEDDNDERITKLDIRTKHLLSPVDHQSSPRLASPASTDSVRSWTFPNRVQSPTASPQLLSPTFQSSPQIPSSPRRNGHRRGTFKDGQSQVLSLSARFPNSDAAEVAAKVESKLHHSPTLKSSSSAPDFKSSERNFDDSKHIPVKSSSSIKRRVSFSPQPDFIHAFENPIEEENDSQQYGQPWQTNDGQTKADGDEEDSIPKINLPDEVINEKDKIDLNAILDNEPNGSISITNGLRGSPLKRTNASPNISGMYSSSPMKNVEGSPLSDKAKKWKPKQSISSLPPMQIEPSKLNFTNNQGPPPSRSWNSNLSKSDSSLSNDFMMTEVKEEHQEDEEEITEGSELSRIAGLPLQSTPPRRRRRTNENNTSPPTNVGDDSLKITLNQLNKVLKYAEDQTGMSTNMQLEATAKDLGNLVDSIKVKNEDNSQEDVVIDQEYVRQLEKTRKKLVSIVKSYEKPIKEQQQSNQISSFMLWTILSGFCIIQFGILILLNAAAHAKAEQVYLTIHYGRGFYEGFQDENFFLLESKSKSSLFAPLFIRLGIIPEINGMTIVDRERLIKSWFTFIKWVYSSFWNYGSIYHPIQITLAKIAYSLGWYGYSNVPLGTIVPS